jgi:hypothetical protein
MALQHLRSSTADKRPTPVAMSDGQLAINTNLASPGLFLKDSNGDLVKVGPVHVGTTAPNATPAAGGQAGNSKGELWLDTTASDYTLKTWDGSAWREIAASGDVTLSGTQTLTNKTLTDPAIIGTILEDVFTITDGAAFEVDPGNGSIQLITLGANRTPKATNFAAGESITLMVDDGTAYTLTWTDATWGSGGVKWTGGSAPTLATTGYTVLQFWKVSTQVYGALVGEVA